MRTHELYMKISVRDFVYNFICPDFYEINEREGGGRRISKRIKGLRSFFLYIFWSDYPSKMENDRRGGTDWRKEGGTREKRKMSTGTGSRVHERHLVHCEIDLLFHFAARRCFSEKKETRSCGILRDSRRQNSLPALMTKPAVANRYAILQHSLAGILHFPRHTANCNDWTRLVF